MAFAAPRLEYLLVGCHALEHRLAALHTKLAAQLEHRDPPLGRVAPVGCRRLLVLELLELLAQIHQLVLVGVEFDAAPPPRHAKQVDAALEAAHAHVVLGGGLEQHIEGARAKASLR